LLRKCWNCSGGKFSSSRLELGYGFWIKSIEDLGITEFFLHFLRTQTQNYAWFCLWSVASALGYLGWVISFGDEENKNNNKNKRGISVMCRRFIKK
jgi:hypothetical protein